MTALQTMELAFVQPLEYTAVKVETLPLPSHLRLVAPLAETAIKSAADPEAVYLRHRLRLAAMMMDERDTAQ